MRPNSLGFHHLPTGPLQESSTGRYGTFSIQITEEASWSTQAAVTKDHRQSDYDSPFISPSLGCQKSQMKRLAKSVPGRVLLLACGGSAACCILTGMHALALAAPASTSALTSLQELPTSALFQTTSLQVLGLQPTILSTVGCGAGVRRVVGGHEHSVRHRKEMSGNPKS